MREGNPVWITSLADWLIVTTFSLSRSKTEQFNLYFKKLAGYLKSKTIKKKKNNQRNIEVHFS